MRRRQFVILAVTALAWFAVGGIAAAQQSASAPKRHDIRKQFNVPYVERDGRWLLLDAYLPEGPGPHPAVVVIHGGAWKMGNKAQLALHAAALARAGFAAFCIQYRLAPEHKWPAQLLDCKAAVVWIRQHAAQYRLRADWVAAYGYSAGAHLACMLGTTDPEDGLEDPDHRGDSSVQAVVAGGTPCDFTVVPPRARWLVYWLGRTRAEAPELYVQASPISHVDAGDAPTLCYHGTADRLVPIGPVRRYVARLREVGVRAELLEIEGGGHITTPFDQRVPVRMVSFLREVLADPSGGGRQRANSSQAEAR